MQKQIQHVVSRLEDLSAEDIPWLIGGDFNLLPPGQYEALPQALRDNYQAKSEIETLYRQFKAIPRLEDLKGKDRIKWFTHFPNDPRSKGPDRTIDYFFHSETMHMERSHVRQFDTLAISDHFPMVAEMRLL